MTSRRRFLGAVGIPAVAAAAGVPILPVRLRADARLREALAARFLSNFFNASRVTLTAHSMSASLVIFPVLNRMVPFAQGFGNPIATKTCEISTRSE
ncbi:MAG: twin-arginine translocation signal domain-containing protein [Gemmatimonadota bacterium]